MNSKLRAASEHTDRLEKLLEQRTEVVQTYENDQKSFRKIAKMAWKAAAFKLRRI